MARSELVLAIARSDAPLPPPEEVVRVPLDGGQRLAMVGGGYLGMLLAPFGLLAPPLADLPRETRQWLVPLLMVLGAAFGLGAGWLLGERRKGARTIAFDAEHVWIERRGEVPDPLPWDGLRSRDGRIPHLVAEDGRAIAFPRDTLGRSPEARYLVALVARLPQTAVAPRIPMAVLAVATIAGFLLMLLGAHERPLPNAEGSFWSSERLRSLALLVFGLILFLGAGLSLLVRHGSLAGERASPPSSAESSGPEHPGQEIAAHFRAHRFRPPAVTLEEGVTYRYREPSFWRGGAKSQRDVRIGLVGLGTLLLALTLVAAALARPDSSGPVPFLVLGGAAFVFFLGLALFLPGSVRGQVRFRVAGDRLIVTNEGEPETSFPWPPRRTREATEPLDWTDELREGRRRLFLDRRLLVADPSEPSGDPGPVAQTSP